MTCDGKLCGAFEVVDLFHFMDIFQNLWEDHLHFVDTGSYTFQMIKQTIILITPNLWDFITVIKVKKSRSNVHYKTSFPTNSFK